MELECKAYPFNTLGDYKYADIVSFYEGKWIFSKHKNRTTWETQGGHIEEGEAPLEAAKRELFEEAGAVDFDIEPLCDYWIRAEVDGVEITGNGQVYFANVRTLGDSPHESEMEKICLFDAPPQDVTYPPYSTEIFPLVLQKRMTNKINQDILFSSDKQLEDFQRIQEKWGIHVYKCKYGGIPAVVKYFEVDWAKREIVNYRLLNEYGIPTIKVLVYGESSVVMEDISASDDWRLGVAEDLQDAEIAKNLAHWYFTLHEQGLGAVEANPALGGEYDAISEESIKMLRDKFSESAETFDYILSRYEKLRELIKMPTQTLTYNDFYWSNFIVRKDKQAAMMFDYNLLGKGFRYSDMRNVRSSMSETAGDAFAGEYKRLYVEKYGSYSNATEAEEKRIDDVAACIYSLYAAVQQGMPKWAEGAKMEVIDGTLLKRAKRLLDCEV